jgi:mono/diheme cytochrome c family protein
MLLFAMPIRSETLPERGRYLVETIAVCTNCHTPRGPNGPLLDKKLGGGEVIKHQDFTAVVPNITPDRETGIGAWTDEEIISAIREGRRPDGSLIGPAMPSRSYRGLGDEDVRAIVAYLRAVPPVRHPVTGKSHYDRALPASWGSPVGQVAAPSKEDQVAYGAYLAGPVARPSMARGAFRSRPTSPQTSRMASAIGVMLKSSARSAPVLRATGTSYFRRCRLPLMPGSRRMI